MAASPNTLAEEKKRTEEETGRNAYRSSGSRVPSHHKLYTLHAPKKSTSVAGSDAHVAYCGHPKPTGLAASMWAPAFVPAPSTNTTMSTPTAKSGDATLPVSQGLTWKPSGVTNPSHPTSRSPAISTVANCVDTITSKTSHPSQRMPLVSSLPVIEKTSIGSSAPNNPPVTSAHPKKTIASLYHKTDPSGDDFEIVGHADADEEFDVVASEGPSASNGTAQPGPDLIKDGLEGAFRSLGKVVLDRKNGH